MLRFAFVIMVTSLLGACSSRPDPSGWGPLATTLRSWPPSAPPTAVVLGLHSFGDYGAAFTQLGPLFSQAGLYLESFDQAGFGARRQQDRWAGKTQLVDDAVHRIDQLYERYQQPVFLLGESMGGAVALLAARQRPERVAGLILAAPAVREGIRFRYGWNAAIAIAATLAPGYRVEVERDPHNPQLSPLSARRLAQDNQVMRRVRLDTYRGLIQIADAASDQVAANYPSIPVLLLYGGKDSTVPAAGIHALRQHLAPTLHWHYLPDAPHLLLQSDRWHTVGENIIYWIQQRNGLSSTANVTSH